jgi:chromosome segregation ATPase
MSDLAELEQRIRAALERIDAGIERLPPPAPVGQAEEIARLEALLEVERVARAEAEASVEALGEDDPELDRLRRQVEALGTDNQRLRATVASLREELRRMAEEAPVDGAGINPALMAELEALRAERASETLEMADILAELNRIVGAQEESAHA